MVDSGVSSGQRSEVTNNVLIAAEKVRKAKVRFAQEFLLAKAQRREGNPVSDKMAEMMALVATDDELDLYEAQLNVWYNTMENTK